MKPLTKLLPLLLSLVLFLSCKQEKEELSDLQKIRISNNKKSYPVTKMDSVQAIQFITKQKLQEFFDLSALYTAGNRDTEIDSVIYTQMQNYFEKPDSGKIKPILQQLDSLKVSTAKIGKLNVEKKLHGHDTVDLAFFEVEYFDRNKKSLGSFGKNAQYMLKLTPVKFTKEFKFYLVKIDEDLPKDSTASGVTR